MAVDEEILQRLIDELEIRNLLARISHITDGLRRGQATKEEYNANWTEDCIWESPTMGRWFGHAGHEKRTHEVGELVRQGGATLPDLGDPNLGQYHMTTTTEVQLDGDSAICQSKFIFGTTTGTAGQIHQCGRYLDEVRRTREGWKMHHRSVFP